MSGLTQPSLTYKPFLYPWAMERAEEHEKIHWGSWEANLQEDVNQWKTNVITSVEKENITNILRIFTQSDCAVGGNYCDIFIKEFKNNEIRNMLLSFANREGTHQRAYALLNDTLGLHEKEYRAFLQFKEMSEKIDFMTQQRYSKGTQFTEIEKLGIQLAQTVLNEGMSLFSAFVMLLNYQRFGKMKGMCEIVEWSIRDETLHLNGMAKLFHTYCKENPQIITDEFKREIYYNFEQALQLEYNLIDMVYGQIELNELNSSIIKTYIRYIGDRRLLQLGLKPIFNQKDNPIPWLDWIVSGDSFKNFFEGTVTDYNASGLVGEIDWSN